MTIILALDLPTVQRGLRRRWPRLARPRATGPSGYLWQGAHGLSIVVSQADWDGAEWIHASIAYPDHDPSYADLAAIHRAVYGRRRYAYQVFAPDTLHVNIHAHALHLWGRADGRNMLPSFGAWGTI